MKRDPIWMSDTEFADHSPDDIAMWIDLQISDAEAGKTRLGADQWRILRPLFVNYARALRAEVLADRHLLRAIMPLATSAEVVQEILDTAPIAGYHRFKLIEVLESLPRPPQ